MKRGYTLYLDEKVISELEKEHETKRLSPSWIVNEILLKKYKLKGGLKCLIVKRKMK